MDDAIQSAVRRLTDAELASQDPSPVSDVDLFAADSPSPAGGIRPYPMLQGVHKRRTTRIGLERGQSSFTVDPLHQDWGEEQSVPREDGAEWPEEFEGEGGHYEGKWRTEEEARRKILEAHPDYQFLTLVAGHSNTMTEQLYEEGDVAAIVRRQQALVTQQRIALEEVRTSASELAETVRSLELERQRLRQQRVDMRTLLVETDRQIQALAFASDSYEEESRALRLLNLQQRMLQFYTVAEVLSDEALAPIKDAILEAAALELDSAPATEMERVEADLRQALDAARSAVREQAEGAPLLTLTDALIDLWLHQTDPVRYAEMETAPDRTARRRQFIADRIMQGGPITNELTEAGGLVDRAELELLQRFYDSLVFMSVNNILAVDIRDIYTSRPLPVAPQEELVLRPFDQQRAGRLYTKYGGTLLGAASPGGSEPYRATPFRAMFREISEKASTDAEMQQRLVRVRSGPFLDEMKVYREWLAPQFTEVVDDLEALEAQLERSRERLARLRSGEATFRDVEQPYRHRRQWVEMPEHSGVVRVKPIVVSAIDAAFTLVKRWAPYARDPRVDAQFMQHDEQIRGDFAKLVAVEMSIAVMRFPKQYLQLGLREFAVADRVDTMNRLRRVYSVSTDPATNRPVARLEQRHTQAQALLEASECERRQLLYRRR